ncbi:mycofactocin-coupled SDR family oxidoreductase [Nocardia aurantia]|uniref:Putative short-chain type dehydrogenase/reductase n=1 Tax=Nocardia aurantia TaxID=2585199 RepID=A0A7K0DNI9_9NOCA|nr:mycofactocin-coupled SDR family oxidoreductase [Nocardia aurantia]MQY27315.1 putative short-chain type dehydrogenase/reductase [Nocardia aurantia]
MTGKLEGRVAFVTGAARGQGRTHAVRLAQEGAAIIATDACTQLDGVVIEMSNPDDLAETEARVKAVGGRILTGIVDVRDFDGMQNIVDEGVRQFGRLDIVVANAGMGSEGAVTHEMSEKTWRDMLDVNLTGVWITARVSVGHVIAGGRGGSVILTSSVGGLRGARNIGHYVSAKHGMIGLMRTLALELGEHNIRVNALCPTQVGTPLLLNDHHYRLFRPDLENPTIDDFAAASQAMHVLPTPWVEPEDISNAVAFLASEESRFITGVALPIDAGNLLR